MGASFFLDPYSSLDLSLSQIADWLDSMQNQSFQYRSTSEQVADFLRERINSGQLQGNMPGVHALSAELGVHHTTAAEALSQLEREGYLKGAGAGKKRKILIPETSGGVRLRVSLLFYEPEDIGTQFINELRHRLDGITVTGTVSPIPEPSTGLLVAFAGSALFLRRRRA